MADQSLQTFLGSNWSQEARLEVEKRWRNNMGDKYDPELLRCSWWLYKREGQTTPVGDWRVKQNTSLSLALPLPTLGIQ